MRITRWNMTGPTLGEELRERASWPAGEASLAPHYLYRWNDVIAGESLRRIVHQGFRALALLRAADKIDARAAREACHQAHHLRERTVSLYVADEYLGRICPSCAAVKPSDGLHYAEGQLFNVKDGRPEPL